MSMSNEEQLEFFSSDEYQQHQNSSSHALQSIPSSTSIHSNAPPPPGTENSGGSMGFLRSKRHPVAAVFHYLFKFLALFFYMFGGFFSDSFVFICVLCILCLAFDFWTVKNVTGRLLVGLRWWNNVKEDGSNDWVFESIDNPNEIDPQDSRIFWWGLYGTPIIWIIFLIVGILKFSIQWMVIVIVALVTSGANIVGYYKCSADSKKKVEELMQSGSVSVAVGVGKSIFSSVVSGLGSAFGGNNSGNGNNNGTGDYRNIPREQQYSDNV